MKFFVEERIKKKKKKKKRKEKKKDIKCLESGFQSYTYVSCFVFVTRGCFLSLSLSLSFISFLSFFFFLYYDTYHANNVQRCNKKKERKKKRSWRDICVRTKGWLGLRNVYVGGNKGRKTRQIS